VRLQPLFMSQSAQDFILGNHQPSLRDCSVSSLFTQDSSWATFSRPCGTGAPGELWRG
jgi:hypothetical protein